MSQILVKPLITEKMTADTEKHNAYGFVVADGANKVEIKKAVEKEYGVTVTSVRTLRRWQEPSALHQDWYHQRTYSRLQEGHREFGRRRND